MEEGAKECRKNIDKLKIPKKQYRNKKKVSITFGKSGNV